MRDDPGHQGTACVLEAEGGGSFRSDWLNADTLPASGDFPFFFELRNNRFGHVAGNGKAEALAAGDDGGVDADNFTAQINERPATVAGVDRRISTV